MHLLVSRFSAIGDVALTVPVLQAMRNQYPDVELSVVSRGMFASLFEPLGVNFIAADLKGMHKGLPGLNRLFRQLKKELNPDKIIDLHSVLRSHILDTQFSAAGVPVYKIDKGRPEKKELTRQKNKQRRQLLHSTGRYAEVFAKAGFPLKFDPEHPPLPQYQSAAAEKVWHETTDDKPAIGIAPLAAFPGKTWNATKMRELMEQLTADGFELLLFGGPEDVTNLRKLSSGLESCHIMAGRLKLGEEVALMKNLKMMISMDSSNLHLATLAGIPVVSIWGATHRFAGFGPLGENEKFIAEISTDELSCRPCSVFGSKPCFREDYACMNWLKPEDVMEKVRLVISSKI